MAVTARPVGTSPSAASGSPPEGTPGEGTTGLDPRDPSPVELGRRIKALRVARGLTLKDLEVRGGISATHVSGLGPDYWERAVEQFAANLGRFLAGQPLLNVVDKRAGY